MPILDMYGRPISTGRRPVQPSRDAGSSRGTMAGWTGYELGSESAAVVERVRIQRRASDLAANDWAAEAVLGTITHHSVGTGLRPAPQIPHELLGISREEAAQLNSRFAWLFHSWSKTADATGRFSFADLQFLGLRSMLTMGEMLHLPVMLSEKETKALGLKFSFALQAVSPLRLRTPSAMSNDADVKDGIRFSATGRPLEYYLLSPKTSSSMCSQYDSGAEFSTVKARLAHRPGIFHLFAPKDDEQIRGVSIFANSANLFRHLDDALAYELVAQVIASKFAVFIEKDEMENPYGVRLEQKEDDPKPRYYQDVDGVEIVYGNANEKPHLLKNERPSSNFNTFVEQVFRAISASAGMPDIVVSKKYERTNYSSARAAQNEAWRVFRWYRQFFGEKYAQKCYEMMLEEAYLRGYFQLPAGAPDFYEAFELWTSCAWHGPARGYMDPTKEIQAKLMAIEGFLETRAEAMAEDGRDFEDEFPQFLREREMMQQLVSSSSALGGDAGPSGRRPAASDDEDEKDEGEDHDAE